MRETLYALFQLQKIDSEALEIERGADAIPARVDVLEAELETHRTELGQLHSETDALRAQQREIEGHMSEETQKHRKWKSRLNEIKSPREYQALSRELELGERQVRENDERVLEILSQLEAKEKVIQGKQEVLNEHEAGVNAKVREMREAQAKLMDDSKRAGAGRIELLKKLPQRLSQKYEALRVNKNGLAVSVVQKGACHGCNVRLRPQHVVEILRYESIEQCPMCQRLLVHEDLIKSMEQRG